MFRMIRERFNAWAQDLSDRMVERFLALDTPR